MRDERNGEVDLATWLIESSVTTLLNPDSGGYFNGVETEDQSIGRKLTLGELRAANKYFESRGEAKINLVKSLHRAEIDWLNNVDVCLFPITLVAKILNESSRDIRMMVARRIPGLYQDRDGLIYGEPDEKKCKEIRNKILLATKAKYAQRIEDVCDWN